MTHPTACRSVASVFSQRVRELVRLLARRCRVARPAEARAYLLAAVMLASVFGAAPLRAAPGDGDGTPEYALKAAVLYNFALFTEWPEALGQHLVMCVLGSEAFGPELDALSGERVGKRTLVVRRISRMDPLVECNLVFIANKAQGALSGVLSALAGRPVLTVAESRDAVDAGVGINLGLDGARLRFEINLKVVRSAGLELSSKLLRLAAEVHE